MSKEKNKYLVKSANWSMTVQVDESIFNDPHIEACTKCIEDKIKNLRNEMTEPEAVEFFEFNIAGSYVGEKTPILCEDYF